MRVLWVSILVVLLDQASKVAVLRLMHRGESIPVIGDWLKLTFTENPGMAFGITVFPREATAIFAIIVTVLVLWYLYSVRSGYAPYLYSLALVLGGAIGNIIDRAFYGLILGYGDLFMGKVVDFIHVDAWRGYLPEALPLIGGSYLPLFPIWNVADMAIVLGVIGILAFQRRFHKRAFEEPAHDRERIRELERERDEARAEAEQQRAARGDLASAEAAARKEEAARKDAAAREEAARGSDESPTAPAKAAVAEEREREAEEREREAAAREEAAREEIAREEIAREEIAREEEEEADENLSPTAGAKAAMDEERRERGEGPFALSGSPADGASEEREDEPPLEESETERSPHAPPPERR